MIIFHFENIQLQAIEIGEGFRSFFPVLAESSQSVDGWKFTQFAVGQGLVFNHSKLRLEGSIHALAEFGHLSDLSQPSGDTLWAFLDPSSRYVISYVIHVHDRAVFASAN